MKPSGYASIGLRTTKIERGRLSLTSLHRQRDAKRIGAVVLLICACNTVRMCRVSTQITAGPAAASALKSHCDRGPARVPQNLRLRPLLIRLETRAAYPSPQHTW